MSTTTYIKEEGLEAWLTADEQELEIEVNFLGEDGMSEGGATFTLPVDKLKELLDQV